MHARAQTPDSRRRGRTQSGVTNRSALVAAPASGGPRPPAPTAVGTTGGPAAAAAAPSPAHDPAPQARAPEAAAAAAADREAAVPRLAVGGAAEEHKMGALFRGARGGCARESGAGALSRAVYFKDDMNLRNHRSRLLATRDKLADFAQKRFPDLRTLMRTFDLAGG